LFLELGIAFSRLIADYRVRITALIMGLWVTVSPDVWIAIHNLRSMDDMEDLFHMMRYAADENKDRPFDYGAQRPIE
jgi:hypothetical protein